MRVEIGMRFIPLGPAVSRFFAYPVLDTLLAVLTHQATAHGVSLDDAGTKGGGDQHDQEDLRNAALLHELIPGVCSVCLSMCNHAAKVRTNGKRVYPSI